MITTQPFAERNREKNFSQFFPLVFPKCFQMFPLVSNTVWTLCKLFYRLILVLLLVEQLPTTPDITPATPLGDNRAIINKAQKRPFGAVLGAI